MLAGRIHASIRGTPMKIVEHAPGILVATLVIAALVLLVGLWLTA